MGILDPGASLIPQVPQRAERRPPGELRRRVGPRGVLDRRGLPQPYVLLLLPGGGAGLLAEGRAEGGRPEVRLPLHLDGQDGGGEVEVSEVVAVVAAAADDDIAVNSSPPRSSMYLLLFLY